jgi:hypothetical protein
MGICLHIANHLHLTKFRRLAGIICQNHEQNGLEGGELLSLMSHTIGRGQPRERGGLTILTIAPVECWSHSKPKGRLIPLAAIHPFSPSSSGFSRSNPHNTDKRFPAIRVVIQL